MRSARAEAAAKAKEDKGSAGPPAKAAPAAAAGPPARRQQASSVLTNIPLGAIEYWQGIEGNGPRRTINPR
eukprot:7173143-Pyramimonas_sp.AAC.1